MRRIVICYAFQGSGHHAAALALQNAVREADPSCSCELVDFFRCLYPRAGGAIEGFYLGVLKAVPFLWQMLYDGRLATSMAAGWKTAGRLRLRRLRDTLARMSPDAVICTQAGPFLALNAARGVDVPLLAGVVTDFVPHRLWGGRGRGTVIVPSEEAAARLRALGVRPERLRVFGIPIQVHGLRPRRIPAEPPSRIVLVMGGGFGLHLSATMIRQIDASPEPFSLQVVAGRNEPFRAALERQRSSFRHKLTVLGYVDNMPERMLAAEVLVTKPGGMTSAEALALGVPMVLLPPLPGQELYNRDFLVGAGAALAAEDGGLCNLVTRLLTDPSRVAALRRRMALLAHPRAADEIAAFVLNATALRAPDLATAGRS